MYEPTDSRCSSSSFFSFVYLKNSSCRRLPTGIAAVCLSALLCCCRILTNDFVWKRHVSEIFTLGDRHYELSGKIWKNWHDNQDGVGGASVINWIIIIIIDYKTVESDNFVGCQFCNLTALAVNCLMVRYFFADFHTVNTAAAMKHCLVNDVLCGYPCNRDQILFCHLLANCTFPALITHLYRVAIKQNIHSSRRYIHSVSVFISCNCIIRTLSDGDWTSQRDVQELSGYWYTSRRWSLKCSHFLYVTLYIMTCTMYSSSTGV